MNREQSTNKLLCLDNLIDGAEVVPAEHIPALLSQLAAIQSILASRLIQKSTDSRNVTAEADRLLTVDEAARKLNLSKDYLYRHGDRLPFAVRVGRRRRFSSTGIERWIQARGGK